MSKMSELDTAVNELIELVGRNLHEMPEREEAFIIQDVCLAYGIDEKVLRKAYEDWREETSKGEDHGE